MEVVKNIYRTHTCGELNINNVGEEIKLSGWVQKIRDLGGMIFIDLRDEFGITQILISNENKELEEKAKALTTESCIHIEGQVVERASKNPNMSTGEIEVKASKIEVLGKCKNVLPFEVNTDQEVREDLRLEYRFLDLRNEKLHKTIILRSEIMKTIRNKMDELGFTEIQTPILANSSPEGARDFLVPSRLHPGEFYALPQAPQQFKQLLMVSGFDKYYQIAPCFRDEDPRADRAPGEFYQLDFEMSFATDEDVYKVGEKVFYDVFSTFSDKYVSPAPFRRIKFKDAILKYGSDKPDLRNPLVIVDVTDIFEDESVTLNAFKGKLVRTIATHDVADQPRSFFEGMTDYAMKECKAKGLAWLRVLEDGTFQGPIAKFIPDNAREEMLKRTDSKPGDCLFFIAETPKVVNTLSGEIRAELGRRLGLIDENIFKFCWIVDFPMYELDERGNITFSHNPFSMPQGGLEALNTKNPLDVVAYQYDIVCNGIELSSGAVRNHDIDIMLKAFEIAGYTKDQVQERFGALYTAFQYGAPPHAGVAPGIDRMIMLLTGAENIREVIAFPLNSKAQDLMMGAPGYVSRDQLRDIHIRIEKSK